MYLRLTDRAGTWAQVLAERLHPQRVKAGQEVMAFCSRELVIPSLPQPGAGGDGRAASPPTL